MPSSVIPKPMNIKVLPIAFIKENSDRNNLAYYLERKRTAARNSRAYL